MPDLVRVLTKSGLETSVSREVAEDSDDLTILDDQPGQVFGRVPPITRKGGRPLLPTTSVDEEATNKAAKSAKTEGSNR